jgi:hypothetical protein
VDIRLLEQFAADRFARAPSNKSLSGSTAMLFEDRENVLQKIELFVTRGCPEIVAAEDRQFLGQIPRLVDDRHAALLTEQRISQVCATGEVSKRGSVRDIRRSGRIPQRESLHAV